MAQLSNNSAGANLTQRDAGHAAKTFTSEPGYTKAPYSGFLFHVNVFFNDVAPSNIDKKTISLLIKASDLPEVQFETETLNQYNRKRIVNKRVIYQPIKLTFHDDVANNVRNMWIAYNQHYNADSAHIENAAWKYDNVYRSERFNKAYGLDVNATSPFLDKIEIHSMGDHKYSKMTLVNPVINSAAFDDHDYKDGAKIMETTFTVEYENIIYSTGGTDQIPNFGRNNPEHYDQNISPLGGNTRNFDFFDNINALLDTPINIADLLGSFVKDQLGIDTQAGRVGGNNNNDSAYDIIKRLTGRSSDNNTGGTFNFPEVPTPATNEVIPNQSGIVTGNSNSVSNGQNVSATLGVATTADAPNSELTETQQTDASINVTDVGRNPTTAALNAYLNSVIPNGNFIVAGSNYYAGSNSVSAVLQTNNTNDASVDSLVDQAIQSLQNSGISEIRISVEDTNGNFLTYKKSDPALSRSIASNLGGVTVPYQITESVLYESSNTVSLVLQTTNTNDASTLINQTFQSLRNNGYSEIRVSVEDTNGEFVDYQKYSY